MTVIVGSCISLSLFGPEAVELWFHRRRMRQLLCKSAVNAGIEKGLEFGKASTASVEQRQAMRS